MTVYKFRNCLLNTIERRVLRDGLYLDMTPRTFDVLQMLVERAGVIVTKDEMLGTIWNDIVVEEGNLPVYISRLRRLLGCSKREHYIETAYGSGYRFVCEAIEIDDGEWLDQTFAYGETSGPPLTTDHSQSIFRRIRIPNNFVIVKIEVENQIERERERERGIPYVNIEVCFAVFIWIIVLQRPSLRRWWRR